MADADIAYPALDQVIRGIRGHAQHLDIGFVLEMESPAAGAGAVLDHLRRRLPLLPPLAGCADHLADHVRELAVPGCRSGAWTRAYDALVNLPAHCARGPWDLWVVPGEDGDGHLLAYRAHHALHDGGSMMRLARRLFSAAEPDPPAPTPAPRAEPPAAHPRVADRVRSAAASTSLLARAPRQPLLPGALDGRRVLTAAVVPSARLRTASRALECSVLDLHVAALSRVAEESDPTGWTKERNPARGIGLPVSVHRSGDPVPYTGNRFAVVHPVDIPWDTDDLGDRARIIAGRTARLRDPNIRWELGQSMKRLDAPRLLRRVARAFAHSGMQSTVLLLSGDLGFAGHRASRFTSLNCLPAPFPQQSALTLWGEQAVCSFTADTALPAAEKLADLWLRAVDVLAPAEGAAT
ncbi:wax ester/triacylglycerol synthase domain-containing protein [Streptomyces fagopyri]|uniref:wax ester/triacylglycerol synthase domain-containing protein n=1 Tax=Streptomyces fagopyri TaxID=2662397 RepID=UPI0033F29A30